MNLSNETRMFLIIVSFIFHALRPISKRKVPHLKMLDCSTIKNQAYVFQS
jgi:hypothetical protein